MPDPVGGNNSLLRNFFNGNSVTTTNVDAGAATANVDPGGATTNADVMNANGFEVGTNTAGGGYTPFMDDALYHDLGGASTRAKGGVEIGTYNNPGSFSYKGVLTRDANNSTTNWNNRNTWAGSTNRNTEGLGTTRGPLREEKADSSLKVGGLWLRDDKIGAQARVSGSVEGPWGNASGSARVYSEVGLKRMAAYNLTGTGVSVSANAEARVVAAGAEVSGRIASPSVKVGGQDINLNADVYGRATVEANATVGGEVAFDRDPPKAVLTGKAGAFAGAKAYGRARFGIGDLIKVGVYGEGWAGAGAEASGTVGYQDGKFSLGGSVGAGLGLGGKVGLRVDVDVVKAAQLAKDVADVDRDGKLTLNDGATAITKTADAAMTGVENTVNKTLNAIDADNDGRFSRRDLGLHATRIKANLENALDANGDGKIGLSDVGAAGRRMGQGIAEGAQALGRGAQFVGQKTSELAEAAGQAAHNLADVNGDGKLGLDDVGVAGRRMGQGIAKGAQALGRGAQFVGQKTSELAEAAGQAAHNLADVNGDGKLGLDDVGAAGRRMGQGIADGAQALGRGAQALGRSAHRAADVNGDGRIGLSDIGAAARNVGTTARNVGRAARNLADANGDGKIGLSDVGAAAQNVGSAVADGAEALGRGAVRAGRAIGNTASRVGSAIANQASDAASTIADGASRTYKRAKNVVSNVASFFGW